MAEASTPSAVQVLNSQPSEPENPNSQPSNTQSRPDSGEAQTSSSAGAPPLNPNPNTNTNPNSAIQLVSPPPPSINHYTPQPAIGSSGSSVPTPAVPSFRPAGAPAPIATPQFIPIPGNPNWQSYQTQNPSAPPPGVSSAPGMMASSVPPPMAPANVYQVPPGQQLNPVMRPPFLAVPSAYMAANVPQAPPVS